MVDFVEQAGLGSVAGGIHERRVEVVIDAEAEETTSQVLTVTVAEATAWAGSVQ